MSDTTTTTAAEPRSVRSLQCWPGGRTLYVSGTANAPADSRDALRLHASYRDADGRPATDEERGEVDIQETANLWMEREIYCCDSSLVTALQTDDGSEIGRAFSFDNVENTRPDPSDWDMAQCKTWLEDEGHDLPDPNPWGMDRRELMEAIRDAFPGQQSASRLTLEMVRQGEENLRACVIEWMDDGDMDGLDDWREAVRDNATDAEIYEWWRVSPWLLDVLRDIGEPVLDNDYGEWWGRTCTGQGLLMDGVLQRAARFVENRRMNLLGRLAV